MKRTGFKRKGWTPPQPRERTLPVPSTLPRPRAAMATRLGDAVAQLFPKHEYVRSAALMVAYRLLPCQHCSVEDGTVCGAHSNWVPHHKGGAIKADDNRAASLCHRCHAMVDTSPNLTEVEKKAIWWSAHVLTVFHLVDRGLWPARVPIPDTSNCPWELPQRRPRSAWMDV